MAVFVVGVLWVPSSSSSFWVVEFVGFCEYSNYGDVQQGLDDEEEQLLELVGV